MITLDFFHSVIVKNTVSSLQLIQRMNHPADLLNVDSFLKYVQKLTINIFKSTVVYLFFPVVYFKCVYLIFLFIFHLRLSRFIIMYEMSFSLILLKLYKNSLQACRCYFLDFNRRNWERKTSRQISVHIFQELVKLKKNALTNSKSGHGSIV